MRLWPGAAGQGVAWLGAARRGAAGLGGDCDAVATDNRCRCTAGRLPVWWRMAAIGKDGQGRAWLCMARLGSSLRGVEWHGLLGSVVRLGNRAHGDVEVVVAEGRGLDRQCRARNGSVKRCLALALSGSGEAGHGMGY